MREGLETFTSIKELWEYCEHLLSRGGPFYAGTPEYDFLLGLFRYWKWGERYAGAIAANGLSYFYAREPSPNQRPRMCAVFDPTPEETWGSNVDFSMKDCVDNFSLKQRSAHTYDASLVHQAYDNPGRYEIRKSAVVIPPKFSETYEHYYAKRVLCDCITEIAKCHAPNTILTSCGRCIPILETTVAIREWPVARKRGQLFLGNWCAPTPEARKGLQPKRADGVPSAGELKDAGWFPELVFDVAIVDSEKNTLVAGIELVTYSGPSHKKEILLCELAATGIPTFVMQSHTVLLVRGPTLFWETTTEFWRETATRETATVELDFSAAAENLL